MYVLEYKPVMNHVEDGWEEIEIRDVTATTCTVNDLVNYQRYAFRLKVQSTGLKWRRYPTTVFATPADATLRDLSVDGQSVAGFSPDRLAYDVVLPLGTTAVPAVTATVNDPAATAVVTNATGLPGSAIVVVTAKETKDATARRTYTVHLAVAAPVTVTFDSNGGAPVDSVTLGSGQALDRLPVPNRAGSIFLGWYTDNDSFEHAVSEETPITSDLTLYARYAAVAGVEGTEEDLFVSAMDCAPDFAIQVESSDDDMSSDAVMAALQVDVIDDTPFAGLAVSGSGGEYTVTATQGYTPGSSYRLTLKDDALTFTDEPDSVRSYCFTVDKTETMDLRLDPDVKVFSADQVSDMTADGAQVNSLSVPLATAGLDPSTIEETGTFTYTGSESLAVGDEVAIYSGTPLDQRVPTQDYSDEPVAYVEVTAIDGTTVTYRAAEAEDVLFTPDVLPVDRAADLDGDADDESITVAASAMTYTGPEFAEMGLDWDTTVDEGDFLAFYTGSFGSDATQVAYAEITSVDQSGGTYTITFADVTEEQMALAMDLYSSCDMDYESALEPEDVAVMEADIERQAIESGFADAAAEYLTTLALKTDGFQTQLDEAALPDVAAFAAVALSDLNPVVHARIYTDLEHFQGLNGLGCEVTVEFEVDCGEDMTINLAGRFQEELRSTLKASGRPVWKKKWIFPYIADYKMTANLDLYNFTGIYVSADLTTASGGGPIDITAQIEELMGAENYQADDVAAETQEFYELYGEMLANEHDYVPLFSENLYEEESGIDPLHITVLRTSMDFDVSADLNLSLGCTFEYEKATRYVFAMRLKAKKVTSDQIDLVDEKYSLEFWVMGTLGMRAGIVMRLEFGLITTKWGSVGIEVETGPYVRLWGYFYYRLAHADNQTTSTASGALYTELGIYLDIRFLAQVGGGEYAYNPTLYGDEFPLWNSGSRTNVYDFSYVLTDATDDIRLKGDNTTLKLPDTVFSMKQLDLKEGGISVAPHNVSEFTITFTNGDFSQDVGYVTVERPADRDITEGYMTVYWNGGPLSFTTVPISRTYHVVWDDLEASYLISFDSQGGSLVGGITGAYEDPVTLPEPTRVGYAFGGWYDNEDCTGDPYTAATMPAGNVQLWAKWTARTDTEYTVKHYLQTVEGSDYDLADTQTLTGTTGTDVTPAVNDYVGFTSPETQTVAIAGDGSTVVRYYYARTSHLLTFTPGNGDPDIVKTVVYGGDISAPKVVWAGYAFGGWYDNEDCTGDPYDTAATMPAGNVQLWAKWTARTDTEYTVKHYLQTVEGSAAEGGTVAAWGYDSFGQSTVPADLSGVVAIAAGYAHSLALNADGTVVAWGGDYSGQTDVPAGLSGVEAIAAGAYHSLALRDDGTVVAWGDDVAGQSDVPADLSGVVAIAAGTFHSLALKDDGTVVAWGDAADGATDVPAGLSGVTAIAAGAGHSLALKTDGTVVAWGNDFFGESDVPGDLSGVVAIAAGAFHNLALGVSYKTALAYDLADTQTLTGTTGTLVSPAANDYVGFTSPETQTVAIAGDGSTVVRYYYARTSYPVTFVPGNGDPDIVTTVVFGAPITAPPVTWAGHKLSGWYSDPGLTSVYNPGAMPAEALTLYAGWLPM